MEDLTSSGTSSVRRTGLFCTFVFVLSCAPAASVCAAADIADITASMQPGTWQELPDTALKAVFPPRKGHPAWGVEGAESVVSSWSGAAFDTHRNRFIVIGGGHAAYGGNEVYGFWLEDMIWHRVTDPSSYEQDPRYANQKRPENFVRTLDGSPISSHTYDGLQYLPGLDKVFMFGGSQYRQGINYDHHAYLFDITQSSWTRGARAPHYSLEVASAYDSTRNRVLVAYRNGLMAYDPAADAWSVVSSGDASDYGRVAAYDPVHDLFVEVGQQRKHPVVYYALSGGGGRRAAPVTGDLDFVKERTPGIAYDASQQVFVIWGGNRKVWVLNPATWKVTRLDNAAGDAPTRQGANGKAKNRGTYSRWQYVPDYDVFIGYNSTGDNVWLYRLPQVPHDTAGVTPATPRSAPPRARSADTASQPAPAASEGPSLPPPGRVAVASGATESSFPRAGYVIMHPGSGSETTTASAGAARKQENCGADLCVGPGYTLTLPSQAAKIAQEGETVAIEAGDYKDCAVWPVSVTIFGIHGRPHIHDKTCQSKGIWITQGDATKIENIEFSGAWAGSGNAAAIRHEGKSLILRDVAIHGNQNGILTNHGIARSLEIYDSAFYHQRSIGDLGHSIYAAKIGRFVVEGSHFYDGASGHFIKTLAAESRIAYNRIVDEKGVDAALIDVWGCSKSVIIGNAMVRTGRYGSLGFIGLTPRRNLIKGTTIACPAGRPTSSVIAYNTAVFNNGIPDDPRWAHLLMYKFPVKVLVANNWTMHTRRILEPNGARRKIEKKGGTLVGNFQQSQVHSEWFKDLDSGDLRLTKPILKAVPISLVPEREPDLPVGTRPRANGRDVGAFAYPGSGGQ